MIAQNLINQKFGRLTVIELSHKNNRLRFWKCMCDCGMEICVSTSQLNSGHKKSCGCIKSDYKKSLLGKKIGILTVIEFYGYGIRKRPLWKCLCECGNIAIVYSKYLLRESATDCGKCKNKEKKGHRRKLYGESLKNKIIASYKSNAKKRNLSFELSDIQTEKLFKQNCFYCNTPPYNIITHKFLYGSFTYNGIDRIDNAVGYTVDNSVSCCELCNNLKGGYSLKDFLDKIEKIYNNMEKIKFKLC